MEEGKAENKLDRLLRRRRNRRIGSLVVVLLVALLLGGWLLLGPGLRPTEVDGAAATRPSRVPPAGGVVHSPETVAGSEARQGPATERARSSLGEAPGTGEPAPPLPELDESDAFVRRAALGLARHPELARWLASDDLVRRFVVAVDNVAEGRSPRRHVGFLAPSGSFLVEGDVESDAPVLADPVNFRRYDVVVSALESLDVDECARLYTSFEPMLDQAYAELGYPERSFRERLGAAASELLSTPIVPDRPRLLPMVRRFEYEDPALEGLSDAQKHLLRMGPRNVDRLQRVLRELVGAIEPSWKAPAMQVYRPQLPADGEG
jgi:hypothetical protein